MHSTKPSYSSSSSSSSSFPSPTRSPFHPPRYRLVLSFKRARAQNRPTPDSTKPAVGRVIHRIKGAVDSLARERSSRAVLELDTAHTFAHLSAQIAGLQTAFTTLADGVIDELDAQREEHARWRRESERWVGKMAHLESEIWKRCDVVDDALDEKNAVSRATFDKLRDEMGHAERAVTEARMALIDAERREAETAHAMASLRAKAEGADLRLQDQVRLLCFTHRSVSTFDRIPFQLTG